MSFDHTIEIHPGRDERTEGKGFSCAELLFVLSEDDADGAMTFAVRTNWLPINMERGVIRPSVSLMPIDVTYHFPMPTLTSSQDKHDICPYLGGPCHSITDHKIGHDLIGLLQAEGTTGIWPRMERMYTQEARINRPQRRRISDDSER